MDVLGSVATATLGALLAVLAFVIGQVVQKLVIEPVQEQRRVIGRIAAALTYYANVFPEGRAERVKDASDSLRQLAGEQQAASWSVVLYDRLVRRGLLLDWRRIDAATGALVAWSNLIQGSNSEGSRPIDVVHLHNEVADALGIRLRAPLPDDMKRR